MSRKTIYLDYPATTPTDPRVIKVIEKSRTVFANPSNVVHAPGRTAKRLLEQAREDIATNLNVTPDEIFFTSGATESNNIVLLGSSRKSNRRLHWLTSPTEHASVLTPLRHLQKERRIQLQLCPVDARGAPDMENLEKALRGGSIDFASLMFANNELGTLNDAATIGALTRKYDVAFHCDATQAIGKIELDLSEIAADFISFSAHKFYGPRGIGVLFARGGIKNRALAAICYGGAQERGIRPGTSDVSGACGMAAALRLANKECRVAGRRIANLTETFWNLLNAGLPDIVRVSPATSCVPGILNVAFPGIEAEVLAQAIGDRVAASLGAACHGESREPSHVMTAIGLRQDLLFSAVRFGLGKPTTRDEIETAARIIVSKVRELKALQG